MCVCVTDTVNSFTPFVKRESNSILLHNPSSIKSLQLSASSNRTLEHRVQSEERTVRFIYIEIERRTQLTGKNTPPQQQPNQNELTDCHHCVFIL